MGGQVAPPQDRRNPVLLLVNMRGGHGGGSGRFDSLEDYAKAYAFALGILAKDQAPRNN